MEDKVMRSARQFITLSFISLAMLLLAGLLSVSPGLAQGLPAEGDPFAGVPAADGAYMSAVSGQPGASGLPSAAGRENGTDCGTACGAGAATNMATPVTQQMTYGNSVTVNVSASNHQTTIVGGTINTSGGLNAAGGGNAGSGN
jgi:hypothetical protein